MRADDATLLDILNAAKLVVDFTKGMDKTAFLADAKTQSAVLHQLLIVGEAVKRLSHQFRKDQPVLPWKTIAAMRDKLIHHYNGVDLDEVWRTLQRDLPKLIEEVERLAKRGKDH